MQLSTILSTTAATLLCMLAVGCSASSNNAAGGGDGGAGGDGGTTPAPGSVLTCSGIIECGSKCADTDDACSDACLAKGSPAANEAVTNIVKCVNDNACEDAACFEAKCPKQLEACVASGKTGGAALNGTAPAGNVPADLVGRWHSYDDFYEFMADGTVARVTEGKIGSCKSSRLEKGTAVAQGTTLTVYLTSAVTTICDKPGTGSTTYVANSKGFTYTVAPSNTGTKLVLTETQCRYSDPSLASQYCSVGYDKE